MSRLPPPCLSSVMEKEKTSASELTPSRLSFPTEFPYEFDSPSFSPGFTSPGDSTETEDESSDDEEDFLAELSRRLAPSTQRLPPPSQLKRQVTSPQSTLSGLGSPNLPLSQTTSFRRDNAFDVISAAAGEVARLKLESYEPHAHFPRQTLNSSLILRRQNAAFQTEHYIQQQRLRHMRLNAVSNATWMPQHAGTPLKRPSTGTGVFLPRRYPASPSEPMKKPVQVNATTMLHSKVNPQQNLDFNEFTNVKTRSSQFDYECMLARSTLHARQGNLRAVGCLNQERSLPQDWMY